MFDMKSTFVVVVVVAVFKDTKVEIQLTGTS